MKKIFFAFLLLPLFGIAQKSIKILPGRDTLMISTKDTIRKAVTVKVQLNNYSASDTNETIIFEIDKKNLIEVPAFIDDKGNVVSAYKYLIPKEELPSACKAKELSVSLILSVPKTSLKGSFEQVGQIILKGQPAVGHELVISSGAEFINTKYSPDKPFWVEVGTNFDLIDGVQSNSPFFGVFFHEHDMRVLRKNKNVPLVNNAHKNIGLFAGVYGSKTVSRNETNDLFIRNYFDNTSFLPGKPDSIRIFKDAGKYAVKTSVRTTGFFASPQLRLSNGSANVDGLHIFMAFWAELQWQQVTQENDFSGLVRIDSQIVGINQLLPLSKGDKPFTNNQAATTDIRSHYLGGGFPIYFREKDIHLFLNPIVGASNQPTVAYFEALRQEFAKDLKVKRQWNAFYAVLFRLSEDKYGISFTGEVRGLLKRDNPPFVSLALSKKFDLTKFLEFK
jgi:hypothetical protein